MEKRFHHAGFFILAILFFVICTKIFQAFTQTQFAVVLGSGATLSIFIAPILWANRRHLAFSLRSLLICVITFQIPLILMINPWNTPNLELIGGLLMMVWGIFLYLFVIDAALARYARERSLERLQMEEPDKIDRFKHGP